MSNTAVGSVYLSIIEDVINSSRVDIEEGGVEDSVLEELRKGWQNRLSQLQVATFPWDPKPEPAPSSAPQQPSVPAAATAVPAHPVANYTQAQLSPPPNAQPLSLPSLPLPSIAQPLNGGQPVKAEGKEPNIKQEPGLNNGSMPPTHPSYPVNAAPGTAAARAAQQLHNNYGQRAAASISAIHSGMVQGGHPQQPNRPPAPGQAPARSQQQYQAQLAAQQQQQHRMQQAQVNGANGLGNSQVDGAGDAYEGVLLQERSDGQVELGRIEIDRMLHEQIAAKAKQMEGGGLMLPLKQATKHKAAVPAKTSTGMSQMDGLDDDIKAEEFDEDAINSDLDDPEENLEDDDDDEESVGPIMLCMYDKVQRVKNKWKCVMKDGVLTVNGKEYVFHKASGEYEW